MFGLNRKNAAFAAVFLAATAVAVGMEVYGAVAFNSHTTTWTQVITSYVPEPIVVGLISLLSIWLPVHFAEWFKARRAGTTAKPSQYATVLTVAIGAGLAAAQTAAGDGVIDRTEWRQILIVTVMAVVAYFVRDTKPEPKNGAETNEQHPAPTGVADEDGGGARSGKPEVIPTAPG